MANLDTILLPDIGDFAEVEIIEILVAPGDRIAPEQAILTLESDKATMEIPSPRGGVVQDLLVKVGEKIAAGRPLLTLAVEGTGAELQAPPVAAPVAAQAPIAAPAPEVHTATPAPAPTKGGATETVSVLLPDIGDFSDVPVIEILVAPGDRIAVDQSILTLETDKATMEVPSPQAGVVEGLAVQLGDKLSQGDLILTLQVDVGGGAA
ncbi:biotin/lipoyl-containing protein, partial [uncultured Thiodictyon sp.]|uniref:biotin/lipoyl-containing protein n=1 Tax=uncultured Thiodictyon sp. TaxID=1846217 RepID=UPI0025E84180